MTTTRFFQSTDASAPTLTGETGSLIALLNACLVGSSGVAYGSGGTAKTSAGWSAPFTNSSTKGVWRNSLAAGGSGCYVRVVDDGALAGGFKVASLQTFGVMTDIDSGSDACPDGSNVTVVGKSSTQNSTARTWFLCADERTWYLWVIHDPSSAPYRGLFGAGDIESHVAGDGYAYMSMGSNNPNVEFYSRWYRLDCSNLFHPTVEFDGLTVGRDGLGNSGAKSVAPLNFLSLPGSPDNSMPAVSELNGNYYFYPFFIFEYLGIRGKMRGLYIPLNVVNSSTQGTLVIAPIGLPPESEILLCAVYGNTSYQGVAVETAASWS